MHIAANIDDCAIIIEDFLEKDYFKKISNFNFSNLDTISSHKDWKKNLYEENNEITMNEVIHSQFNILEYEKGKLKKLQSKQEPLNLFVYLFLHPKVQEKRLQKL